MSLTFLALYRGDTANSAKLLALTAEPDVVREFVDRMLPLPGEQETDPILRHAEEGRRAALRLLQSGASK